MIPTGGLNKSGQKSEFIEDLLRPGDLADNSIDISEHEVVIVRIGMVADTMPFCKDLLDDIRITA